MHSSDMGSLRAEARQLCCRNETLAACCDVGSKPRKGLAVAARYQRFRGCCSNGPGTTGLTTSSRPQWTTAIVHGVSQLGRQAAFKWPKGGPLAWPVGLGWCTYPALDADSEALQIHLALLQG
eukprot:TRINITY_DN9417_c0_g1_i1.p3 TRINITY_DN9417_c0_g1~~TRINITY_DN9417_c0_g1_i1.p3  ORF type:complete len:123 (-),score=2.22 TRINITY_DN9417_c0_g1_i1:242-610(-)